MNKNMKIKTLIRRQIHILHTAIVNVFLPIILWSLNVSGNWNEPIITEGSQIQLGSSLNTVQGALEDGFKNVFKMTGNRPVHVSLLSRTDKGVHGLKAALSVFLPPIHGHYMQPEILKVKLNAYFKTFNTIRILEVYSVANSFLFSKVKKEKTYLYRAGLLKEECKCSKNIVPITEFERTYFINSFEIFDFKKAKKAAKLFEGEKNFGAVVGKPSKNSACTVCNITTFDIEKAQPFAPFDKIAEKFDFYHFICKGDRFLYHMVRRIVSLTLGVGFGKLSLDDIQKLFDEPNPSSWPKKGFNEVPGYGLYLVSVNFDFEEFIQKENSCFKNSSDEV